MCAHTQGHTYGYCRAPDISYECCLEFLKLNLSTVLFNLQVKNHHAQNNFKPCLMPLQTLQIALLTFVIKKVQAGCK